MPNAAILIVGNEILSGRTQDVNIKFIAERLNLRGIRLMEVRIVRDEEDAIIKAVHDLSANYGAVFSTGGIGPTHDDITVDCIAKAFDVEVEVNAEAQRRMEEYCKTRNVAMNEGRMRMTRIPKGATLIDNPVSAAPGFKINNVYVMAGVPNIMQGMFAAIEPTLAQGVPLLSNTVSCSLRESDIAIELEKIQKKYPDLEIGSYPGMAGAGPHVSLVIRGTDEEALQKATKDVSALVKSAGDLTPVITYERPPKA
jgi:molybdenum cofactor synthesis domain-containing protein